MPQLSLQIISNRFLNKPEANENLQLGITLVSKSLKAYYWLEGSSLSPVQTWRHPSVNYTEWDKPEPTRLSFLPKGFLAVVNSKEAAAQALLHTVDVHAVCYAPGCGALLLAVWQNILGVQGFCWWHALGTLSVRLNLGFTFLRLSVPQLSVLFQSLGCEHGWSSQHTHPSQWSCTALTLQQWTDGDLFQGPFHCCMGHGFCHWYHFTPCPGWPPCCCQCSRLWW